MLRTDGGADGACTGGTEGAGSHPWRKLNTHTHTPPAAHRCTGPVVKQEKTPRKLAFSPVLAPLNDNQRRRLKIHGEAGVHTAAGGNGGAQASSFPAGKGTGEEEPFPRPSPRPAPGCWHVHGHPAPGSAAAVPTSPSGGHLGWSPRSRPATRNRDGWRRPRQHRLSPAVSAAAPGRSVPGAPSRLSVPETRRRPQSSVRGLAGNNPTGVRRQSTDQKWGAGDRRRCGRRGLGAWRGLQTAAVPCPSRASLACLPGDVPAAGRTAAHPHPPRHSGEGRRCRSHRPRAKVGRTGGRTPPRRPRRAAPRPVPRPPARRGFHP